MGVVTLFVGAVIGIVVIGIVGTNAFWRYVPKVRRQSDEPAPGYGLVAVVGRCHALACCVALMALPNLAFASGHRSLEVKHEFQRHHPCPSTGRPTCPCPGYIKDHIVPLARGGLDAVSNMQWQTIAAAKAKDRWETKGCRR
jgi:hypothetical protein